VEENKAVEGSSQARAHSRWGGRALAALLGTEEANFGPFAVQPRLVEQPWGYEIVYAATDQYCGKILLVQAGEELSLHYHRRTDETLYLTEGLAEVTIGDLTPSPLIEILRPGGALHVPPGTVHRLHALEDSVVLEVSTPERDDAVAVEDAYGRAG
jgi:mannose-6-phosphate isomerase